MRGNGGFGGCQVVIARSCVSNDAAISGVCYYFMRLPRSLRLLAMTT
ncbi:hypothetical protein [Rickettsia hoogstraalii]|nr:hypothetical protein [Rickettsia hoogstraalii]